MKKVFSSHSQLAHTWANQLQSEGRAANMYFEGPVIFSYGPHYEIARFVEAPNGEKVCFVNANGYSNSTAKHTNHVHHAIPDGIKVFKVPFIVGSSYSYRQYHYFRASELGGIVAKMLVECTNLLDAQLKARTKFYLFNEGHTLYYNIVEICQLFDIPVPARPENYELARLKSENLRATELDRELAKRQKALEKSRELLAKWLSHEFNGQLYDIPVHLRISKDGKLIETTKGARVSMTEALRLLAKLRKGEDVKGETIEGFTVIENNETAVKIGCHVISWPVINELFR